MNTVPQVTCPNSACGKTFDYVRRTVGVVRMRVSGDAGDVVYLTCPYCGIESRFEIPSSS